MGTETTSSIRVLISAERIRQRVLEMAAEIDRDYATDQPLCLIGILKGSVVFLADLARAIQRPLRLDFIGISSYGKARTTSGEVKLTKDLDGSIDGADVLIVEDIIDSGVTLNYLSHVLSQRNPRSLRIAALLDKPSRRVCQVDVAYVGFDIPDEFVIGYGLDFGEKYRNLPDVCVLEDIPGSK